MTSLRSIATKPIKLALGAAGLQVSRKQADKSLHDQPDWIQNIIRRVSPFTMTSPERLASLCQAIAYVEKNNIEGDIIECGVWKGGSMMAAALALKHFGDTQRSLFLFDTFDGMSEPSDADVLASSKQTARALMDTTDKSAAVWAYSPIEEVHKNIRSVGYPDDKLFLVQGKVEETIPYAFPKPFAIVRLDTDWYESTRHELEHLYPKLVTRGVLIIDDYGHWEGARRAVDEYIEVNALPLLLNRIDYTGRIAIKP